MELQILQPIETKRTYIFKDYKLVFFNITHFASSTSTHRLKDEKGVLYIVPNNFRYIEIHSEEFTL